MLNKPNTTLFHVIVYDTEQLSLEKQLELAELLETKKVKSNGRLTIICDLKCDIRETKLKIANIIKDMLFNKRTPSDLEKIPKDKLDQITNYDLSKINLGFTEYQGNER